MSDRLPMSGNMPADVAERLSDAHDDLPTEQYMAQAREDLIDRLVEGKTVHRHTARDVFDTLLAGDTSEYHELLEILESLLALNCKHGDDLKLATYALADKTQAVICRFVDAHPDWIETRAEEIALDAEEDQ